MDKKHCLCCGEDVPYHTVAKRESQEIVCSHCGFPLEVIRKWDNGRTDDIQEEDQINSIALVADDSDNVRKVIVDMLNESSAVRKVIQCKNGLELVKAMTEVYREKYDEKKDIQPAFAIIDLNMPQMDGITAARSIRSHEEKNNIDKIPIVFFSSILANEKMRTVLNALAPAVYINKGNDPDRETLMKRVKTLLTYVGEKFQT